MSLIFDCCMQASIIHFLYRIKMVFLPGMVLWGTCQHQVLVIKSMIILDSFN